MVNQVNQYLWRSKLNEMNPRIEDWKKLYNVLVEIKDIAPWDWLDEHDLFAVQNPKTKEIGFVSVMGTIGEHYAISVYLGEQGFYRFWDFQHSEPDMFSYQKLLEIPQIQASFEDHDILDSRDLDIIKKLSLTFKGKQSWPMFRSYKPGLVPWFLDLSETQFLQCALEQTKDVCLRAKNDHSLLRPGDDETFLLRKMVKKGKKISWYDSSLKVMPRAPYQIEISINEFAIKKLRNIVPRKMPIELDVFMSPAPVKEKGMRPYYPYVLMLINPSNGVIVGHQLLKPLPSMESMWGKISFHVAEFMVRRQLLPEKILVNSDLLFQLLSPLGDDVGFSVEIVKNLPNITQARVSYMEFIERK